MPGWLIRRRKCCQGIKALQFHEKLSIFKSILSLDFSMRNFFLLVIAILAFANSSALAYPYPITTPESVKVGDEAVKLLWDTAVTGTFLNTLPREHFRVQPTWGEFLEAEGARIVEDRYK